MCRAVCLPCFLAAVLAAPTRVSDASRICMVIAPTDFTDREYADPGGL